jgi:hypothetical protein
MRQLHKLARREVPNSQFSASRDFLGKALEKESNTSRRAARRANKYALKHKLPIDFRRTQRTPLMAESEKSICRRHFFQEASYCNLLDLFRP